MGRRPFISQREEFYLVSISFSCSTHLRLQWPHKQSVSRHLDLFRAADRVRTRAVHDRDIRLRAPGHKRRAESRRAECDCGQGQARIHREIRLDYQQEG